MTHYVENIALVGKPAWHGLGDVYPQPVSAAEAFSKWPYAPVKEQAYFADGMPIPGRFVIYRKPTLFDPELRVYGMCTDDYQLYTPADMVEAFDANVIDEDGKPAGVESVGALKHGRVFFISAILPEFTINGDQIKNYILLSQDIDGASSIRLDVTSVRVVCWNTLSAGLDRSSETHAIRHGADVRQDVSEWLARVWGIAMSKRSILQQAYEALAARDLAPVEVEEYRDTLFADPGKPDPDDYLARKYPDAVKRWEARLKYNAAHRTEFDRLWAGEAYGYGAGRMPGTAWDGWQVATQIANHFSTRRQSETEIAQAILDPQGTRRVMIERAFDLAYSFVSN